MPMDEKNLMTAWGAAMRQTRIDRRYSHKMMKEKFSVCPDTLFRWERGLRAPTIAQWTLMGDGWPTPPVMRPMGQARHRRPCQPHLTIKQLKAIKSVDDPALSVLPERARQIVQMRVAAGLTIDQVADEIDCGERGYAAMEGGLRRIRMLHIRELEMAILRILERSR